MSVQNASALASGKGHTDENFPVASLLVAPQNRAPILAFYRFARTADDVSDDPHATPHEKLAHLAIMRGTLAGERDDNPEALALRQVQQARGITPQHGLDLLEAFRRDVTKLRYADWADLMDYCRYSAAPVGRFVLDVHAESRETWPANDALCSALQVINHLQDCGKDYRDLDRVYIPQDHLQAAGIGVEALAEPKAPLALKSLIADLAGRTAVLLGQSRPFAGMIRDGRLRLEVAVIQRLAEDLSRRLSVRDPLSERVHHSKAEAAALALTAAIALPFRRRSTAA
ncbi:squalene synthase HpnC [Caulobacter sp. S45]|uniref:squalene synthase HpnC n=1 Tax=Caulobacter sp. S45 TaxID=1641861 RepID=UPI001576E1A0|nr:squalene synthase HpnC [Caulobacter sp. S45]